jgi:predicted adenine nucleotide alpha hydrolase (AANH) superfamily ATPase
MESIKTEKVLLHICCGPCAITPVQALRAEGALVVGFFYRHNIHPFTEMQRRAQTLADYAERIGMKVIFQEGYDLEGFIRRVVYRETRRCMVCYHERLRATARLARASRFDAFTTTLLYSKFQRHELIREIGESVGREIGIPFAYRDFRSGWQEGVETSRRLGMYRQPYCGCIYSEKERYAHEGAAGRRPAAEDRSHVGAGDRAFAD